VSNILEKVYETRITRECLALPLVKHMLGRLSFRIHVIQKQMRLKNAVVFTFIPIAVCDCMWSFLQLSVNSSLDVACSFNKLHSMLQRRDSHQCSPEEWLHSLLHISDAAPMKSEGFHQHLPITSLQ